MNRAACSKQYPLTFEHQASKRTSHRHSAVTMASCSMRAVCQARPVGRPVQASGSRGPQPGQRPIFSSRSLCGRPAAQQLGSSKLSRCSGGCLAWPLQAAVGSVTAAYDVRVHGSNGAPACCDLPGLPAAAAAASCCRILRRLRQLVPAAAAAPSVHKHQHAEVPRLVHPAGGMRRSG